MQATSGVSGDVCLQTLTLLPGKEPDSLIECIWFRLKNSVQCRATQQVFYKLFTFKIVPNIQLKLCTLYVVHFLPVLDFRAALNPLVRLSFGVRYCCLSMSIRSCWILNSIFSLADFLRSSRFSHFKDFAIFVTHSWCSVCVVVVHKSCCSFLYLFYGFDLFLV